VQKLDRRDEDAGEATRPVVECFQPAQPVLLPQGATLSDGQVAQGTAPPGGQLCERMLVMEYSFGNSYDRPFVGESIYSLRENEDCLHYLQGNYVPPKCDFNRVVLNFTSVSQGRQYDRLAFMYIGDTEVWRTSTAEPTSPPGIRWVYLKDMTPYLSLWRQPQKIIFDLGNLINDKYTGPFNTTLHLTFFKADVTTSQTPPSDLIIPITAKRSADNKPSQWVVPVDTASSTVSFPRNANRAVFSVSVNGQASEEFWWSNVLSSDVYTFNDTSGTFPGYSPFREAQVYIDGQLAGVQWPFQVIFTGGIVPSLHRPIVGIDVFDLREHEIDITPWLPLLCDGKQHTFSINIAGIADDGVSTGTLTKTVGDNFPVTGKIFVWLDPEGSITTGTPPVLSNTPPTISISRRITKDSKGLNDTLDFTTAVTRVLTVQGNVISAKSSAPVTWSQSLSYSNRALITAKGYNQLNDMTIRGVDGSAGPYEYRTEYNYPLWVNTTYDQTEQGNLTIWGEMRQTLELQVRGASVYPDGLEAWAGRRRFPGGSALSTTHDGTAYFYQTGDGKNSTGYGLNRQVFRFGGISDRGVMGDAPDIELYSRDVSAANNTVTNDRQMLAGAAMRGAGSGAMGAQPMVNGLFAQAPTLGPHGTGPRAFMGRGGAEPEVAVVSSGLEGEESSEVVGQIAMGP
jgi:hypothetical protein